MSNAALEREALRIYRRYAEEVVERFNLCPWAERARKAGRTAERVLLGHGASVVKPTLDAIDELAGDATVEVGLLIYPDLEVSRLGFEHFTSRVRDAEQARHELGAQPFVMAAFHPESPADLADPERLIPFIRRSPDPTIQLVRQSVLERVRGNTPQGTEFVDVRLLGTQALQEGEQLPLRKRIATANLETVERVGPERLEAIFAEIRRDRDASYARARSRSASRT